ncbi:MAG: DUF4258 domain-containing protein [Nitrospinae bacterium]|nr:DUF4258 domain-containing protein [Nitrospinota bacterium]
MAHSHFTDHARREMEEEPLGRIHVDEMLQALDAGEIIEEYLDDQPYASCLILGFTAARRAIHVVCAPVPAEGRLIIITTYQPDPDRWEPDFRRRK